jgi:hypothetical protein
MTDIFISYARQDQERVEILAKALASEGWSVFWDRTILPGTKWHEYIRSKLEQARCVVVAWSAASIESDWVHDEANAGRKRNILVPVLFGQVSQPLGFQAIQAADLSDWEGSTTSAAFRQLVEALHGILGPVPAKDGATRHADTDTDTDTDTENRQKRKVRRDLLVAYFTNGYVYPGGFAPRDYSRCTLR